MKDNNLDVNKQINDSSLIKEELNVDAIDDVNIKNINIMVGDKISSAKSFNPSVDVLESLPVNKLLDLEVMNYANNLREIGKKITPTLKKTLSSESIDILYDSLRVNHSKYLDIIALLSDASMTSEIELFYSQMKANVDNVEKMAVYLAEYLSKIDKLWFENKKVLDSTTNSFAAQNIAIIRLIPGYEKLPLPLGSKKVLKSLTRDAAKELIKVKDFLFDPIDYTFYFRNSPNNKISANDFTVTTSSLEMFEEITLDDLLSFQNELFKNANLAFRHKTGEKIFNIIKDWNSFVNFEDIIYYHARKMEGDREYLDIEMLQAPNNVSSHGRYNNVGRSCYYVTETKEGAIKEIVKHSGGKKNKIQIVGLKHVRNAKIIDLSGEAKSTNLFIKHLRYSVDFEKENGKIIYEYLLPNYVADCCRVVGIDGIKYKSDTYNSLVLWEDSYFKILDDNRDIVYT